MTDRKFTVWVVEETANGFNWSPVGAHVTKKEADADAKAQRRTAAEYHAERRLKYRVRRYVPAEPVARPKSP